jgi:hypothetical protein
MVLQLQILPAKHFTEWEDMPVELKFLFDGDDFML